MSCLLCYITVVNKGDVNEITKTTSTLTWFEEWLLYLTIIWGRTFSRWFLIEDHYNISVSTARSIFNIKQQKVMDTMNDWPKYTNYKEDEILERPAKWDEFFHSSRIIMLDMTDIKTMQISNAEARLIYSQYYNSCCGKGGIFLQSSSWIGTHDLSMG